ncbi:apolipoprotein N-acyltransferase [Alkalilimnicola sp. S0819]|uniref:apolipoprotein N-acyltransferase n=1 Tax=Alkalilimnicola sp. S0819 TaxID=2613922 RepID=UPI0012619822|nr:apolipoprotein N-acyltransferase [Alkalilimnicola sp. S0819]KAB7628260.1 apolipoprotein N-acyltransferase [Alkalilimnicola sp. S0819]MPQ15154.1 apolipoprotein N-acyltransferase [Alkalilimnicola sp. S0819]
MRTALQRWLAGRRAWLAGLAGGAALPLGFAPFEWWWLAPFALSLLFVPALCAPRRQALLSAWCFGFASFGLGCWWVYISISQFGGGPLVAVFVCLVLAAVFALFPLLAVWLTRRLCPRPGPAAFLLALPAAWILVEWLRSWLLTGNPWLSVGYTQTGYWLSGVAPVFGVLGVGLLLCLAAGLLAWSVAKAFLLPGASPAGAAPGRESFSQNRTRGHASLLQLGVPLLVLLLLPPALDRAWSTPTGEPLRVALVQGNVPQGEKWLPEQRLPTLERYVSLTVRNWDADLVLWPETAVPDYAHRVEEMLLRPLRREAARHGTAVVFGAPVHDFNDRQAYNSLVTLDGRRYDKRHLVPFGEYVPLRDVLGRALDFLGAPMSDFSRGTGHGVLEVAGVPAAASICYEVIFPAEIAEALPHARLLLNVSNDAWFGDSLAMHQHLQMARMRAIETARPMIRATNTGITALIDHRGRVTERLPAFQTGVLRGEVQPREGGTPYVHWRDWPVVGFCLVMLIAARRRA